MLAPKGWCRGGFLTCRSAVRQRVFDMPLMICLARAMASVLSPSNSVTRPTLMPTTGVLIGTPASRSARMPPQTEAIEVEPYDSHTSLLMRIA